MNSMFTYVLLGVSMAAPIGPVKTVLLNKGIRSGFFHAWFFSLGAIGTDLLYMLAVYFGVAQFIGTPFVRTLLWSFGCFVLLYTGIENLLKVGKIDLNIKLKKYTRLRHSMGAGFMLALLNPLTILFWLGIYGSILANTKGGNEVVLFSVAIMLGIMIIDLFMSIVSSGARKLLSGPLLNVISIISSISMIGFGLYFGYQAFIELFINH